eukprot:657472-Pleurochrysis_carterae.AAC.1
MLTAVVYQGSTTEWHQHDCQKSESEVAFWAGKLELVWHLVVLDRLLVVEPSQTRIFVHRRVAIVRSVLGMQCVVVAG